MPFNADDVAASLEDAGGTVTSAAEGRCTTGILREREVFRNDGQGDVKIGTATLRIGRDTLTLTKQEIWTYRESTQDPARRFRVRDWQLVGAFVDVILAEET